MMEMETFIELNREEIDQIILSACPNNSYLSGSQKDADEEREMWIINDEFLYDWAKRSGVDVEN